MTVCIAWRNAGKVSVCSDSRYSIYDKPTKTWKHADIGAKIFSIPTNIRIIHQNANNSETIYNKQIGIAFAGDVTEAILIKDIFQELLSQGTFTNSYSERDVSIVANLLKEIAEYFTSKFFEGMDIGLEFTMFLILQAIDSCEEHCFRLDKKLQQHTIELEEIICENNKYSFAGKESLQPMIEDKINKQINASNNIDFIPISALRELIASGDYDAIGGEIQYGQIHEDNFSIRGGIDVSLLSSSGRVPYQIMGIDVNDADFTSSLANYTYTGSFIDFSTTPASQPVPPTES